MYKGKAIYNPSGKAGEYSYWACNFYVGCSNECAYCYLKKGRGAKILGGNKPELKKCFKDEIHAFDVFEKELLANLEEIKQNSLFFSFTTDPLLLETARLTIHAISICNFNLVPVKILTKSTEMMPFLFLESIRYLWNRDKIAIGFTLTGHDELEYKACTNKDRINAMSVLKSEGFKTFASIEPIIDFPSAKRMISETMEFCDLYKIGLESGKKYYATEARRFVEWVEDQDCNKVYLKESLQKLSGYSNDELSGKFVNRNYNIFE